MPNSTKDERHRRAQVRANLRERVAGRRARSNERAKPRRRVGVRPRDVDVGVEPVVEVPREIGMRLIGILEPEQLAPRHADEIIALEALRSRELRRVEAAASVDGGSQEVDLAP